MDARLVTWIATANDVMRLDQPLRSRFKEFHIQLPTAEQCLIPICAIGNLSPAAPIPMPLICP